MADQSITIVTPFSGKRYCLYEYASSLFKVLRERGGEYVRTYVIYDNSRLPDFHEQLLRLQHMVEALGLKVVYYRDDTEGPTEPPFYPRMLEIYSKCYNDLVPADTTYVLNIEDDVQMLSDNPIQALLDVIEADKDIAQVEVATYNRRAKLNPKMMVWVDNPAVPSFFPIKALDPMPTEGTAEVKCAAMCFSLFRFGLLQEIGLAGIEDGVWGVDRAFGIRANKAGKKIVALFDLQTAHLRIDVNKVHEMRKGMLTAKKHYGPGTPVGEALRQKNEAIKLQMRTAIARARDNSVRITPRTP